MQDRTPEGSLEAAAHLAFVDPLQILEHEGDGWDQYLPPCAHQQRLADVHRHELGAPGRDLLRVETGPAPELEHPLALIREAKGTHEERRTPREPLAARW